MEEQSSEVEKENTLYVSETRYVTIHLAAIYGNLCSGSSHASAITENIAGKKNNFSVHSHSAKGTSTAVLLWPIFSHISLISIAFNVSCLYQITDSM